MRMGPGELVCYAQIIIPKVLQWPIFLNVVYTVRGKIFPVYLGLISVTFKAISLSSFHIYWQGQMLIITLSCD